MAGRIGSRSVMSDYMASRRYEFETQSQFSDALESKGSVRRLVGQFGSRWSNAMAKWWATDVVAFWQSVPEHPLPLMGYIIGAIAGAWMGINPFYKVLVTLMAADIITGLLAGRKKRSGITSDLAWVGMRKKAIVLILCGIGNLVTHPAHVPFDIGATLAGFYTIHELISSLENAKRLGVPIPPYLLIALNKAAALAGMDSEAIEAAHESTQAARESLSASKAAERKIEAAVAEKGPNG